MDGLIVVGESTDPRPSISRDLPVPVVYAYAPSDNPDDVSFVPDDVDGAAQAVRHLVTLGRRRIAHVTGPQHYQAAQDRAAGVTLALEEAGLPMSGGQILYGVWSQRWGRQAPPLTTIDMNLEVLGCTAAQHLFAAMDGQATPGVHRMPCRLIIRESTV